MRRREFITLVGGAAAAWPLAARGQQAERIRFLGVITPLAAGHPDDQLRHTAFLGALTQLGWTDGRNMRVETRHSVGDPAVTHKYAAELVALAPDVIDMRMGLGYTHLKRNDRAKARSLFLEVCAVAPEMYRSSVM